MCLCIFFKHTHTHTTFYFEMLHIETDLLWLKIFIQKRKERTPGRAYTHPLLPANVW